jgi:hypothetical protein
VSPEVRRRGRGRCFVAMVDGEPVRVQGDPQMSDETREHLAELIRATRRRLATGPAPKIERDKDG